MIRVTRPIQAKVPTKPRRSVVRSLALSALQVTALAILSSGLGRAEVRQPTAVPTSAVGAKISYCQDCHGPLGQGYRGYFPIPRLAGQQPVYIQNQLRAFIERRRENNTSVVMYRVHGVAPAMAAALAARFSSLNPPPIGGAPRRLVEQGRTIFQDGVPGDNIAACAACHGPDAQGYGEVPRLAGQLYSYTVKELANWATERNQQSSTEDVSKIMAPIAHSLNRSQIEAVVALGSPVASSSGQIGGWCGWLLAGARLRQRINNFRKRRARVHARVTA
jgi:cytochrome c553